MTCRVEFIGSFEFRVGHDAWVLICAKDKARGSFNFYQRGIRLEGGFYYRQSTLILAECAENAEAGTG